MRWLQGKLKEAQTEYETASILASSSPSYALNLAGLYAEEGKYDDALEKYRWFEQDYPMAALEAALIYRLQARLKEAAGRLRQAVDLLNNAPAMARSDNQLPWKYKAGLDGKRQQILIHLSTVEEKRCYVYLTLAASLYLDGSDAREVRQYWQQAQEASAAVEIRELAGYDLRRLAEAQPAWAGKIRAFAAEFD